MEIRNHIHVFIGLATFGLGLIYFGYTNYVRLVFIENFSIRFLKSDNRSSPKMLPITS